MAPPEGPPYPSRIALLGGIPSVDVDVPISAVVIFLFVLGAIFHMTILQRNKRRGHKFLLSGMLFGLCMARIVANVLRIAWATHNDNISLGIAANIFANLGVILLFVLNILFAQRIVRAFHPRFGWSLPGRIFFRFWLFSCAAVIILVIVAIPYSSYTIDRSILTKLRDIQLTAITFLNIIAFIPVPIVYIAITIPHQKPIEKFGSRSMRAKIMLVIGTSLLLTFGASLRTAGVYLSRPVENPAWYHSRAVYYCAIYVIELICVYTYGLVRFDLRFWIPDGSSAPGHYSSGGPNAGKGSDEEAAAAAYKGFWTKQTPSEDERRLWEQAWESQLQIELERRGSSGQQSGLSPNATFSGPLPMLHIPNPPSPALLSPASANRRPSAFSMGQASTISPMSPKSPRSFGW